MKNNIQITINGSGLNEHYTSSLYLELSSNDNRLRSLGRTKVVFSTNEKNKTIQIPLDINSPSHNLSPHISGTASLSECTDCSIKNEGPKAFNITKAYALVNLTMTGVSKEGGEIFWKFSTNTSRDFNINGAINILDGMGNLLSPEEQSIPWVLNSQSNEVTITRNIARNEIVNDRKRLKFELVIHTEEAAFRYHRDEWMLLILDDTSNNP